MKSILFVCLGNICRSPIADGIARDLVKKHKLDILVDGAGTGSWHIGEPPCKDSQTIAKQNGVDISMLRARQVNGEDIHRFDVVVAMDAKNVADLKALGFKNVVKLGDFGLEGEDVPDPYFFNGFEGFDKVYNMIDKGVQNLFEVKLGVRL